MKFSLQPLTVGGSGGQQRMDMSACVVYQMPPNNTAGRMVCQCKASAAAVCQVRGRLSTITRIHFPWLGQIDETWVLIETISSR